MRISKCEDECLVGDVLPNEERLISGKRWIVWQDVCLGMSYCMLQQPSAFAFCRHEFSTVLNSGSGVLIMKSITSFADGSKPGRFFMIWISFSKRACEKHMREEEHGGNESSGSVWVCARVLGRGEESGKLRGRKKKKHPDAVREHTKRKGKRQLQCLGTDNVVEQRHSMTR